MPSPLDGLGLQGLSAVTVGDSIYLFGGDTWDKKVGITNTLLRFDTRTQSFTKVQTKGTMPRIKITSAIFDGTDVYLFGGFTAQGLLSDQIIRFNPKTAELEALAPPAVLPSPRGRTAAFFDGRYVWILGGNIGSFKPAGYLDEIVRFDPKTHEVKLMNEKLPFPVANRIGVVFDGKTAYLPGGMIAEEPTKTDKIVAYGLGGGVRVLEGAALPFHADGGAFELMNGLVVIMGGGKTPEDDPSALLSNILLFDPASNRLKDAGVTLPSPRKGTAAARVGDSIYLFGGKVGEVAKITLRVGF
jgi:N-acetylneuraminic acid mutarotase